jgi:hypothetical protein
MMLMSRKTPSEEDNPTRTKKTDTRLSHKLISYVIKSFK